MELESRDLLAQKREELKAILPEIFDDGTKLNLRDCFVLKTL
jgi:hypothetical protein